ncbi:alpha/beta fold hydrolase [Micromonospora sp. URMC 105]|uniref:alpha/beta fold hydrolase n=1 Tax=Micromonospora sp. URMC 105 TaxID=3423413 RepID=UPI003F1B5C74
MANPVIGMVVRPFMQRRNARKLVITSPNGIREEKFVTIGGIAQWVTIRGHDRSNPVLVILHGGPASPYVPFNPWLSEWEHRFTVVQWNQRGAGNTYEKNGESGSAPLSLQRLADDGLELVRYVQERLGKEQVVLLGSSVGSLTGLLMIRAQPESFAAYVGTDQSSPGGIEASYALTLAAAESVGDRKGAAALRAMGADKTAWSHQQYLTLNKLSIKVTRGVPNAVNDLMLPALLYAPDCTMKDIRAVQKGMAYSARQLYEPIRDFDFDAVGYRFDVPFFVFQGAADIVTPVSTARAYVERVHAPKKAFVTIPDAGHLAEFANPRQFLRELVNHVLPCTERGAGARG